jgi:hypothetical protein
LQTSAVVAHLEQRQRLLAAELRQLAAVGGGVRLRQWRRPQAAALAGVPGPRLRVPRIPRVTLVPRVPAALTGIIRVTSLVADVRTLLLGLTVELILPVPPAPPVLNFSTAFMLEALKLSDFGKQSTNIPGYFGMHVLVQQRMQQLHSVGPQSAELVRCTHALVASVPVPCIEGCLRG